MAQVSLALQITARQVQDHVEAGNFYVLPINDAAPSERQRLHLRIMRFSVEAWWYLEVQGQGQTPPPITLTPEHKWWLQQLQEKRRLMSSSKI